MSAPRTITALDVPLADVEQQLACAPLLAALAYRLDLFLVAHPKACATNDDYPGFADWVARQQKKNDAARRTR